MDERTRDLERRAALGDPVAREELVRVRLRAGRTDVPLSVLRPLMGGAWLRLARAIRAAEDSVDEDLRLEALLIADLLNVGPARLLHQRGCGAATVTRAAEGLSSLGFPLPSSWGGVLSPVGAVPSGAAVVGMFLIVWTQWSADGPADSPQEGSIRFDVDGLGEFRVGDFAGKLKWSASRGGSAFASWTWRGQLEDGVPARGTGSATLVAPHHLAGTISLRRGFSLAFEADRE